MSDLFQAQDGDGNLEAEASELDVWQFFVVVGPTWLATKEMSRALTLLGIDRDVERLVEELDSTQDGVVSFDEFLTWWRTNIMEASCSR